MKTYKIIIIDMSIKANRKPDGMKTTMLKSEYKIENFKRKIERYFGKKGV